MLALQASFCLIGFAFTQKIMECQKNLSEQYREDYIILVCDGAAWHKSNELKIPENIEIIFIPPYIP